MSHHTRITLAGLLAAEAAFAGCAAKSSVDLSPRHWPAGDVAQFLAQSRETARPHPMAVGKAGIITGGTGAFAVRAGLEALKQGGSAVDAALTTALAQVALVGGSYISYTGFMTMLYYEAKTGKVHAMNAGFNTVKGETDPRTIPIMGTVSGRTVLVPGFMAGVQAAHERFGKLPFAALFDPAIYLAEQGLEVGPGLAATIAGRASVLTRREEARRMYVKPDGTLLAAGDTLRQPDLAATLRRVAKEGAGYMSRGPWAERFVALVRQEGGRLSLDDLAAYQVLWDAPIQTAYRGFTVYAPGPPNAGGTNQLQALNLLELADLPRYGHYSRSPEALYWLIQIARAGEVSGGRPLGFGLDPAVLAKYLPGFDPSPAARLTKESARRLWEAMQSPAWKNLRQEAHQATLARAETMNAIFRTFNRPAPPPAPRPGHSDCVVAVDAEGNVVALVHTINSALWGDGFLVDGVSVPNAASFQQELIAKVGPGARLPDPTDPLIVVQGGKPVLASATIGGGLHEATLQRTHNVLDFHMDPKAAGDTTAFGRSGMKPEESYKQSAGVGVFPEELRRAVAALGQEVLEVPPAEFGLVPGLWIGITLDPLSGVRKAATLPRHTGTALAQ